MALARRRTGRGGMDYWPGFVDALSTLLLVVIFFLTVFMLGQFFVGRAADEKDQTITKLNAQLAELTDLLGLERGAKNTLQQAMDALNATLVLEQSDKAKLNEAVAAVSQDATAKGAAAATLGEQLAAEKEAGARAIDQITLLNNQLAALRQQLAALEQALQVSEARDKDSQVKIQDLGQRLNLALAQRVQELTRYRSEFFGRLRELLGSRSDIRVVGDRFVFDAAVLFGVGSDELGSEGFAQLDKLAPAIVDLEREIPPSINWIIRVDGHTDKRPLSGGRFADNWALSTARASSVVKYLIAKGVSPQRLAAAGFGEYQPLVDGDTPEQLAQNRRIEFKLTER
jgi:chemotaxis protein MotB